MNLENSRDYYGKVLQGSQDLRTDACCGTNSPFLRGDATISAASLGCC